MKRLVLSLLMGALAGAAFAQAEPANPAPRAREASAPYSGGGIRGAMPDLAEGVLLTPDEVQQFRGAEGFDGPRPLRMRAALPTIEVLQPNAMGDQKVKAPFPITIKFKARDDAPIVPSSFKVLYGGLRMDITSRITKFVKPTEEGLTFDKAQIPAGKHRLFLVVEDAKQRVAERELRIEVE
jgi:hypothetical protein